MAAVFGREQIGIKRVGGPVTVPNNNKAKLMYYLSCVSSVLELDSSPVLNKLKDYSKYSLLDEEDTDMLLILVTLISPDELIGKVFFPSDNLGDSSNRFYELSQVRNTFAVTDSIIIGGQRKQVKKIMLFENSWMQNNFIDPYKSFSARMQRITQGRSQQRQRNDDCTII